MPTPWPHLAPRFGAGMPPAVDVPEPDRRRLDRDVVPRYQRTLATFAPEARAFALSHPPVELVDDDTFVATLTGTLYANLICPGLDPGDEARFAADLEGQGEPYTIDLSPLGAVRPIDGVAFVPTVTLLWRSGAQWSFDVRAIALCGDDGDEVLRPGDPRWPVARLLVLQGLAQTTVTGAHARLHFPMDAVVAVSRALLAADHPVRRVVDAHSAYELALDHRVLEHPRSILRNDPSDPYACLALPEDGCRHLVHLAYAGVAGHRAWPRWTWPRGPRLTGAPFHATEVAYHEVIATFTRHLAETFDRDDEALRAWADALASWLPGFPDGAAIGDALPSVLAMFVLDVSVMHSAEHEDLAAIPVGRRPFRLRLDPSRPASEAELRRAVDRLDVVRTCFADEMYFRPQPVTLLEDVDYGFEEPQRQSLQRALHARLEEVDRHLDDRAAIRLGRIARGIEF